MKKDELSSFARRLIEKLFELKVIRQSDAVIVVAIIRFVTPGFLLQ
jgi:hypothetical protein